MKVHHKGVSWRIFATIGATSAAYGYPTLGKRSGPRLLVYKLGGLMLCVVVCVVAPFSGLAASAHADAAWLLWHHTYTTRAPKDVKPADYGRWVIQNDWVILNAVETRDQCRSLLREEFSKKRDWMIERMIDPGGTVNQSPLADGVNASLWSGRDIKFGQTGTEMRLGMQQDFWCLPGGVDPRTVRINLLEQQ
jgi:hypothetical protein